MKMSSWTLATSCSSPKKNTSILRFACVKAIKRHHNNDNDKNNNDDNNKMIIIVIIIIIIIIIKTAIKNFSIIVSMFRIGTEKGHFERYVTIY